METVERVKQVLSRHGSPKRPAYAIDGKNGHNPFSHSGYLSRLFTFVNCPHFTLSRPPKCSAVGAALNGFTLFDRQNGGIECVSCRGRSWQPWRDDIDRHTMADVYADDLANTHLVGCQWRILPCLDLNQYFDCHIDVLAIISELSESWKSIGDSMKARRYADCGWRGKSGNLAECVLGCSTCIIDPSIDDSDDDLLTRHYYYCPWRWGNGEHPSGYANVKKCVNKE